MKRICSVAAFALVSLLASDPTAAQAVATYEAVYDISYKGRDIGTSRFSVKPGNAPGSYRFLSNSELTGLIARIVVPHPVVEDSSFTVVDGHVRPIAFRHEDGSRSGEANYSIRFDWPTSAEISVAGHSREIVLEPGVLDRGSAQVSLARAVASGSPPRELAIIDDDGLETYRVSRLEPAATSTAAGEFQTVRYEQHREGSSRRTVFWLAPELRYLPVRIEQLRNGEVETAFSLSEVTFRDP
jgi:hypothetical protein